MSKLVWDKSSERLYETGVENLALFLRNSDGRYSTGIAWNGVTSISESPSGGEPTAFYANDSKYLNIMSVEQFAATIEAYTYPDEFAACDGSAAFAPGAKIHQQTRTMFGLCYKTLIGNDVDGNGHGYKLHLIYNAKASPTEESFETVNDSPDAITFSWEINTTPVEVTGYRPTSIITIDSTKVDATKLAALEDLLFGRDNGGTGALLDSDGEKLLDSDGNVIEGNDLGTEGYLLLPAEIIAFLAA